MKGLTEKQQNILKFIAEFEEQENMAPTVYEIADQFGIKTATVFAHIRALQRKGALTRTSQARSIKLTNSPRRQAAEYRESIIPLENSSETTGELMVDRQLLGDAAGDFFAYKMIDNALRDFGIFTDDIVIVHRSGEFRPGDLVAVEIAGQTIIRSAYPSPQDKIELRPANPDFAVKELAAGEFTLRGVVTALQREY
ncbi:MAG: S24 family peptidase [Victivallales bacterium]|nr:S24 family peptidase [Victivallales bacterium]